MIQLTPRQEYMRKYRAANKEKIAFQDKGRTRKKRHSHKLKAIEYLGGKCSSCGLASEHPEVYDFHHLDPSVKEKDPGMLMHCSWERLQKELDKCVLLCANCHRIAHAKEKK